ncbi:MAG TPA: His/Gly/Thr/Pro-type tRNA ligase C-terminal domain-containing protein, partial [Candidatus Omnitrophota bacterium]|nr:His/Gly/Thr/Pro-type tRNA ligase C-terminal domain-containing protein [Candidatus Omnitrophota bacterium]
VIEQNHDDKGIIWPKEVAPFDIVISPLDVTNASVVAKAKELHDTFEDRGYKVLLDDRDERAGVKFKDAELIGIPAQIVIGRDFIANGTLEYKNRRTGGKTVDTPSAILALLKESIK